jgi:hypothetical protein
MSAEGDFALGDGQGIFPQSHFGLGNGAESNFALGDYVTRAILRWLILTKPLLDWLMH